MPNDDLISRADVLDLAQSYGPATYDMPYGSGDIIIRPEDVMALPAVNTAPVVYAHWEEEPNSKRHWHCSNCKTVRDVACIAMNYCPHCGAKMAEHPVLASGCGQTFSPDKEEK